ncbi:MAG TPA: glycosyltransferase family 9 protein [bacterium]|nr:glycosyltransferase family 9 protein [bacterium]
MTLKPSTDCRWYLGDRPCRFKRLCPDCPHHAPRGAEILIIKLGALGDVLRTTALLPALRRRHGDDAFFTWVTRPEALDLVANQPLVDETLPFDLETAVGLRGRRFDTVYVLDKDPAATGLGLSAEAGERRGFTHDGRGALVPANPEAEYYWRLGLDDEEKFSKNTRSYQELLAGALALDYRGEPYELRPSEEDRRAAADILDGERKVKGLDPDARLVGLNIGAGGIFANKNWPPGRYAELMTLRPGWTFLILGGPAEARAMEVLGESPNALAGGSDNPLLRFAALAERCDAVVTGDTLGLHVALAVGTPVAALFGPTTPREIDLYGLGEKLMGDYDCAPCYRRTCDVSPSCVEAIGADAVLEAVERILRG